MCLYSLPYETLLTLSTSLTGSRLAIGFICNGTYVSVVLRDLGSFVYLAD